MGVGVGVGLGRGLGGGGWDWAWGLRLGPGWGQGLGHAVPTPVPPQRPPAPPRSGQAGAQAKPGGKGGSLPGTQASGTRGASPLPAGRQWLPFCPSSGCLRPGASRVPALRQAPGRLIGRGLGWRLQRPRVLDGPTVGTADGGSPVGIHWPGRVQGLPSLERARSVQGAAGRGAAPRTPWEDAGRASGSHRNVPQEVGGGGWSEGRAALTHFSGGDGASSSTGRPAPPPTFQPARKPLAPSSAPPPCGCKRQQTPRLICP